MEERNPLNRIAGPPSVRERIESIPESEWRPRVEADIAQRKAINEREDAAWLQRVAAQNEAREAERRQLVDRRAAELKTLARNRFLQTPGSREEDFEAAWPAILREFQVREVTSVINAPLETTIDELKTMRRQRPVPAGEFIEVTE
jgi:hypothetical protein